MPARRNLTHEVFGSVTVLEHRGTDHNGRSVWLCRCTCGVEEIFSQQRLFHQKSVKCVACLKKTLQENGRKNSLNLSKIRRPKAAPASISLKPQELEAIKSVGQGRIRNGDRLKKKFQFAMLPIEKEALKNNALLVGLPVSTLIAATLQRNGFFLNNVAYSDIDSLIKAAVRRARGQYNNLWSLSLYFDDSEWKSLSYLSSYLSLPRSRIILSAMEVSGMLTEQKIGKSIS